MSTISLCMIVKNEEETLARCLDSVREIADEIIIVDTGSTDNTKEIAKRYTDKIYDFEWIDDFSAARNFSYSKATMEYILWLDADDVILEPDRIKLKELKRKIEPSVDFILLKYNTHFDTQGKVVFSYFRERLSKRSLQTKWEEPVHEYLQMSGKIKSVEIGITHQKTHPASGGRNVKIYEKLIAEGKDLSPRGQYYFARELKDHGRYDEAVVYFSKFLDSGKGWVEDNIGACSALAACYQAKGETQKFLQTLFRSFEYAAPRPEVCCQIGYHFKAKEQYKDALIWFQLAVEQGGQKDNLGFRQEDYWGYIPCIELCVCYYHLGNISKAIRYNNQAAAYKPNDPAVMYNKDFFRNLKKSCNKS